MDLDIGKKLILNKKLTEALSFFLKELGNPYNFIFLDKDGIIAIEWGAFGVPETFLIHNNKIIKKIIGPINEESLLEIERLIQ